MAGNSNKLAALRGRIRRRGRQSLSDIFCASLLLLAVFFVFGVFIFVFGLVYTSPRLEVAEIQVAGLETLTEKEILELAGVNMEGNILAVNLSKTARRIKTNPWVKETSIARELPGRIRIEIIERKAAVLLKRNDGLVIVDTEGYPVKNLGGEKKGDLPVLTGAFETQKELDGLLFKKVLDLSKLLSPEEIINRIGSISEIHLSDIYGISVFTDRGLSLSLGFDDYEIKKERLLTVLEDLDKREISRGFIRIDLTDPDKVTVGWRDMSQPKERIKIPKGLRT